MATPGGKGTKKGRKRTRDERERDLAKIAEHYLRGYSHEQIAERVGLSRQQIGYDLKVLRERWRESQLAAIDEVKARELEKLDRMESELWEQWERSKGDRTRRKVGTKSGAQAGETREMVTEERLGDPRYMQAILQCIEKRTKLLGLDAPLKVAETDAEGRDKGVVVLPGIAPSQAAWEQAVAEYQHALERTSPDGVTH